MKITRAILILFFLASCARAAESVRIIRSDGQVLTVQVELADSPMKRARGLMYRRSLPERSGMLFLFPFKSQDPFWMKNTRIPLDMIFVNQGRIVDIIPQAEPYSETLRQPKAAYDRVLEVPGGFSEHQRIRIGDAMESP